MFPQSTEYWGNFYFWNEIKYGFDGWLYTEPKNFFIMEVERCSRYALPLLKDAKHLVTYQPDRKMAALPKMFKHSDSEDETTEEYVKQAMKKEPE